MNAPSGVRSIDISYSLPQADFEMRQLLSRMIRTDAKIEVVDYGDDDNQRIVDTKNRYNVFFGSRKPEFFLKGAKQYIMENFGAGTGNTKTGH